MFVLRIISKSIKLTLIGLGLLVTVIAIALASSGANKKAAADFPVTQPAASQPATSTGKKAKSKPAKPAMTVSQQEAIQSAQQYLETEAFSRAGLIQQLSSSAGEGFPMKDAVFAVNHITVNWNAQAVKSAKEYLQIEGGFSRAGLIQQLESQAGEGFTHAQAVYAANHVGL